MTTGGTTSLELKVNLSEPGEVQSGGSDPQGVTLNTLQKQHDLSVLIIKEVFL